MKKSVHDLNPGQLGTYVCDPKFSANINVLSLKKTESDCYIENEGSSEERQWYLSENIPHGSTVLVVSRIKLTRFNFSFDGYKVLFGTKVCVAWTQNILNPFYNSE